MNNKISNFHLFTLILPTSSLNFCKIFIFSESLDPQDHFGTNGLRIHPVLMKKNTAPRKWSYEFVFSA